MNIKQRTVYLDHAAATPVDPAVAAVMSAHLVADYGNASTFHSVGRRAFDVLAEARSSVAASLAVEADEIIFTGSGTESDNLGVVGAARSRSARGRHIIVSSIEHKAVLESAAVLEREGFVVTYLPVTKAGVVTVESVKAALQPDTVLVSVMYANNEIGTIQPIREIADMLSQLPASERPVFHTDACQAAGSLPVEPRTLGVDLMTLNGSKIYGPKGVGVLWVRAGVLLEPLVVGGSQEAGRRAGTENVPTIAGMAAALAIAVREQGTAVSHLTELRDYFADRVLKICPDCMVTGDRQARLPNNLHIIIPDLEGESLVLELDQYGVCCATGSACSAHDLVPSHVLRAVGIPDELIHGSLRFSLGRSTTRADIDHTVMALGAAIKRLRSVTAAHSMRTKLKLTV